MNPIPSYYLSEPELRSLQACQLGKDHDLDGLGFYAICLRAKDGDTLQICYLRDRAVPIQLTCRLAGLDTPEMKPRLSEPNRDKIKALALDAMNFVQARVLNQIIWVQCGPYDKYGRPLVWISYYHLGTWVCLNQELLDRGLAKPYLGGKKPVWKWEENPKTSPLPSS